MIFRAFKLTREHARLSMQSYFMVYAQQHTPNRIFQYENFKAMLRPIAQNENAPLLTRTGLSHCVQGKFNVFVVLLQHIKEEKWQSAYGNPFFQCLHDGWTLSNHAKYQAIGNYFVDVKCGKNYVLAIGFVRSLINTDERAALLLEKHAGHAQT